VRLHRLTVTALQAFAGTQEVDFDALSEAGLFLLHGDTGAGKTTLLDAIVFALFGDVPGERAGTGSLRSDHAASDVRTEVQLEATLRGRRVRITRRPKQERPKLRGDGMTVEQHAVTVEGLDPDGSWRVLATRADDAGLELERLLGMNREQFCQVVLLPQGAFAKFLRAGSDEREALLKKLFAAERFTDAEAWLRLRRQEAAAAKSEAAATVQGVAERIAQAGAAEPPEDWAEAPGILEAWADGLAVPARAEVVAAESMRDREAAVRTAAAAALAAGRELAARRTRHAEAVARLAGWEARRAQRDAAEAELRAAGRAAGLEALLGELAEREAAAASAQAAAETALAGLGAAARSAPDPAGLQVQAIELRARLGEARGLRAVEDRVASGEQVLTGARGAVAQEAEAAREAGAWLASAAVRRVDLSATVERAREAAASLPGLQAGAQGARTRAEAAARRDDVRRRLAGVAEAALAARAAEQEARQAWLDVREARLAGMAAHLAAELRPGEPCTVCGAVEHPSPAAAGDGETADAAAEQAALVVLEARSAEREAQEAVRAELDAALAAALAVAGEDDAGALRAAAVRGEEQVAAAVAAAAAGDGAAAALAQLEAAQSAREAARATAEQARARGEALVAQREAALAEDRALLAAGLDGAPDVAALQARLTAAAEAHERAAGALERAVALQQEAAAAGARAAEAARGAGFADLDAARAAARDEARREDLAGRLREFDDGLAELRALAADEQGRAAAASPEPDLAALEAESVAADAASAAAERGCALAAQRAEELTELRGTLSEAVAALRPLAERARQVRELAHLVDGSSAANRLRMRLSAYVLAARLEEIAAAASGRLEAMSGGRYTLIHCDEGGRGRSRGGLELRVVDGWTGRERAPATLSGGETFLASLALALGLADVVAAESGGARLETLFVDEGFGTLDERALEEVLEVLDRLRDGGRAVGIVSHVAELRDRVHARVHVVKGRAGSHVVQATATPA
jgi:exonuclease SbcC